MLNEEEVLRLIDNPMKTTDTFKFSCKACGNCCRNRIKVNNLLAANDFDYARGKIYGQVHIKSFRQTINEFGIKYVR